MTARPQTGMRVAFRVEGAFWCAYAAQMDTMKDAVLMGSIAMSAIANPTRRVQFMELMKSVMEDHLAEKGARADWQDPQPAPEHERGSRA